MFTYYLKVVGGFVGARTCSLDDDDDDSVRHLLLTSVALLAASAALLTASSQEAVRPSRSCWLHPSAALQL